MNQVKQHNESRSEHGGSGINLLIVLVLLILIGNAGYNYVPVAYEGQDLKQDMQTAVVRGMAVIRGKPIDSVRQNIKKIAAKYELPANAIVEVKEKNQVVHARIVYTKKVDILPFGIYQYSYAFNHTATPSGFLVDSQSN